MSELVKKEDTGSQIVAQQSIAPVNDATTMLGMIGGMASSPDCDIGKVERLMALQFKMQDKENEASFNAAMSRTQSNIGIIVKNEWNGQTKSGYADIAAVNTAITPVYTAEGISLSFNSGKAEDGIIPIVCYVSACGHTREYHYDSPITDKGIKGTTMMTQAHARGSAISYGRRYLTAMIFNLATADDDGNSATQEVDYISIDQQNELHALCTDNGILDQMMKWLVTKGIGQLSEIKSDSYDAIMRQVTDKVSNA